jgi:tRNA-splicing ligase RtcB (3'-phosphate/5'-hydroxy nucleic acid ligase)
MVSNKIRVEKQGVAAIVGFFFHRPNHLVMGNYSIKTNDLSRIGYTNDIARSIAITLVNRQLRHLPKPEVLQLLMDLQQDPEAFLPHPVLSTLAQKFITKVKAKAFNTYDLLPQPRPLSIYGGKGIEGLAKR